MAERLLIDGKKVCGILTEMNAEATRVRYIVVGIGINVNQTISQRTGGNLIASRDRKEWSRVELVAALLKSLDREYRQLLQDPMRGSRFCVDLPRILPGCGARRSASKKMARLRRHDRRT